MAHVFTLFLKNIPHWIWLIRQYVIDYTLMLTLGTRRAMLNYDTGEAVEAHNDYHTCGRQDIIHIIRISNLNNINMTYMYIICYCCKTID